MNEKIDINIIQKCKFTLLQVANACKISKRTLWRYKDKEPSVIKSLKEDSKFGDTYLLDFDDVASIIEEWNRGRTTDRKSVNEVLMALYQIAMTEPTMCDNVWSHLPTMAKIIKSNSDEDQFIYDENSLNNSDINITMNDDNSMTVVNKDKQIDELSTENLKLKNELADLKNEMADYKLKFIGIQTSLTEKEKLLLEDKTLIEEREKKAAEQKQIIEQQKKDLEEKEKLIEDINNMSFRDRLSFVFKGKKTK